MANNEGNREQLFSVINEETEEDKPTRANNEQAKEERIHPSCWQSKRCRLAHWVNTACCIIT